MWLQGLVVDTELRFISRPDGLPKPLALNKRADQQFLLDPARRYLLLNQGIALRSIKKGNVISSSSSVALANIRRNSTTEIHFQISVPTAHAIKA